VLLGLLFSGTGDLEPLSVAADLRDQI